MRIWHTEAKVHSGLYAVDGVKRDDIWKVYQAWGLFTAEQPPADEKTKPPK